MASRGRAFCPGHVTAFFHVVEDDDPLRMGSRGAGLCLGKGVVTEVEVRPASTVRVDARLEGQEGGTEVTVRAVELFLEEPMEVRVRSEVHLPISQGFGMSGAGALSALLALNEALGQPRSRDEVVALAHRVEVESRTGLGDVYPQSLGGLDIREEPGAPPYGVVHRVPVEGEVVLCVVGPPLATRAILSNEMVLQSVNSVGQRLTDRFLRRRDPGTFFRLGWQFARQTVLSTSAIHAAVLKASLSGQATMCMLGNAIFAMGDAGALARDLEEHGDVVRTAVEARGARVV